MVWMSTFNSEAEVRVLLVFQIWCVAGFLSHMLNGDDPFEPPLWKIIFYMALGPLNIIRIIIKKATSKEATSKEASTYTKWYIYYKKEGETTFVVYKTRYERPNWWPKNISSPGYKETIKLATIYTSLQRRYITGHHLTGYYIDHIEWNTETNISFIDRLHVWKKEQFIDKHELYLL